MDGITTINRTVNDNADSIAIGSATKGGLIKVYGNSDDFNEFKTKINTMLELRKWANAQIEINNV